MKTQTAVLLACVISLGARSTQAQFGPRGGGAAGPPRSWLSSATASLFGKNSAFTADMEIQTTDPRDEPLTMPGKMAFDNGKSRFEMDMSQLKSSSMPAGAAAQMKAMGMDKMVTISRPDKKATYMVYPGMQAYVENPIQDPTAAAPASDFKVETTELGKETLDGHPSIKSKAVVTDKEGNKHESTVWNATDLKQFPIKIEQTEQGKPVTMVYRNVKLEKPDAALFEAPSDFARYDSPMTMMQQQMMKKYGGAAPGGPPPPPPPKEQ